MTTGPTEDTADVESAKRRLVELRELIPAVNEDRQALYDERRLLVFRLRDARVKNREIADLAGLSVDRLKQVVSSPDSG